MCVRIVSLSYITLKAHHPHGRVWISDQEKKTRAREIETSYRIVSFPFLFFRSNIMMCCNQQQQPTASVVIFPTVESRYLFSLILFLPDREGAT